MLFVIRENTKYAVPLHIFVMELNIALLGITTDCFEKKQIYCGSLN